MIQSERFMNKSTFKEKIIPFNDFLNNEATAGIILLFVTMLALILSNLPFAGVFANIWRTEIHIEIGGVQFGFFLPACNK